MLELLLFQACVLWVELVSTLCVYWTKCVRLYVCIHASNSISYPTYRGIREKHIYICRQKKFQTWSNVYKYIRFKTSNATGTIAAVVAVVVVFVADVVVVDHMCGSLYSTCMRVNYKSDRNKTNKLFGPRVSLHTRSIFSVKWLLNGCEDHCREVSCRLCD